MTIALAHDPAVPQRDALLDADLVAERLERLLATHAPIAIDGCARAFVRYRPGDRVRVRYRVEIAGAAHDVSATTFAGRADGERAFRRAAERALPTGSLAPVSYDRELDTLFWTFPNDRRIRGLAALADGSPTLGGLLGRDVTPRLVTYTPERFAAAACLDDDGATVAYAKAYADATAARAARVHAELSERLGADDPWLRLPAPLAWSARERVLACEAVGGRPLHDLSGDALRDGMGRLGAALARLHGLPPAGTMGFGGRRPLQLVRAADAIVRARPDAAPGARAVMAALLERWADSRGPLVCAHGDVTVGNVLVADGRVTLIDLDDVAYGPAAADVGRVLSWVHQQRRLGALADRDVDVLTDALLDGYGEAGPVPAERAVRWHLAASLFVNSAAKAVTRLNADLAAHLSPLLRDATELLG